MSCNNSYENYSKQWEMGEPYTVVSQTYEEGELMLMYSYMYDLPCGDKLMPKNLDGDYFFARIHYMLRSKDGGKTWEKEEPLLPSFRLKILDENTVRAYSHYSIGIKNTDPMKYIFNYRDSHDGGRTFGPIQLGYYQSIPGENTKPHTIGDPLFSASCWSKAQENLVYWKELLLEAGWSSNEWQNVVVGDFYPSFLELVLEDGSRLSFFHTNIKGYYESDSRPHQNNESVVSAISTDGGINWRFYSIVAPYEEENPEGGLEIEHNPVMLNDGRIYVVLRAGGGGMPLLHAWSSDRGKTWTKARPIDERVAGLTRSVIKLSDGALAMTSGRPGMYLMFDPTGTGEHWEIDDRFDIYGKEELTVKANTLCKTSRTDITDYISCIHMPKEKLWWARQDLLDGNYLSWDNHVVEEVGDGIVKVEYDLQSFVEYPGAEPVVALRSVKFYRKN